MKKILLSLIILKMWIFPTVAAETNLMTASQLEIFCKGQNFGVKANGKVGDIKSVWETIVKYSKNEGINHNVLWSTMQQMLESVARHVKQVSSSPDFNKTPLRNISVEGLPVSGMAVNDVKDPEVRKRYEEAIEKNNEALLKNNYRLELNQLYDKMLQQAREYVVNSFSVSTDVSQDRLKFLGKLKLSYNQQ